MTNDVGIGNRGSDNVGEPGWAPLSVDINLTLFLVCFLSESDSGRWVSAGSKLCILTLDQKRILYDVKVHLPRSNPPAREDRCEAKRFFSFSISGMRTRTQNRKPQHDVRHDACTLSLISSDPLFEIPLAC